MPLIGKVYRPFNPRTFDHTDPYLDQYVKLYDVNYSAWYNKYGVTPKVLDGAVKSIKRYNRPPDPLSEKVKALYDVAFEWAKLEFDPFLSDSKVTSYDAIQRKLDWSKSPGYPWTLRYGTKGDYWLSPDAQFYDDYWERLATDHPILSFCSTTIKKELRPSEKIEDLRLRTITAMDVNHTVATSALCLDQNEKLIRSHMRHSIVLGVRLYDGGWHELHNHMTPWGPDHLGSFEIDGEQFDGAFYEYVFQKIRDLRIHWLRPEERTPENVARMHNLYRNLYNRILVNVDGCCYLCCVGNPSGQSNTTPDNSLKSFMDMVVLWLLVTPPEMHDYQAFKLLLRLCINGDDVNMSVHDYALPFFNNKSIKEHQHHIGMVYTSPTDEPRHFRDTTFLGHGFLLLDAGPVSLYVPTIDSEKMKASLVHFNETGTPLETIQRLCGLRNETWADSEMRAYLVRVANWYRGAYMGVRDENWHKAWNAWLSDEELRRLYTGIDWESKTDPGCELAAVTSGEVSPTPDKIIDIVARQSLPMSTFNRFSTNSTALSLGKAGHFLADLASGKMASKKKKATAKKSVTLKIQANQPAKSKPKKRKEKQREKKRMATTIKAPLAVGTTARHGSNAEYKTHKNGSVTVSREEFVASIASGTNAGYSVLNNFPLNVANSGTFPWLSSIAGRFRKYKIHSLSFRFQPVVSATVGGMVGAAVDYDCANTIASTGPPDLATFMGFAGTMGNVWTPWTFHCSHRSLNQERAYYADAGPENAVGDEVDTPGRLYIATNGIANTTIGLLYVRYSVTLMEPSLIGAPNVMQWGRVVNGGTLSVAKPLGTSPTTTGTLLVIDAASGGFYFRYPGTYYVCLRITGSGNTNAAVFTPNYGSMMGYLTHASTWTANELLAIYRVGATGHQEGINSPYLNFGFTHSFTSVTGAFVDVYPVPRALCLDVLPNPSLSRPLSSSSAVAHVDEWQPVSRGIQSGQVYTTMKDAPPSLKSLQLAQAHLEVPPSSEADEEDLTVPPEIVQKCDDSTLAWIMSHVRPHTNLSG